MAPDWWIRAEAACRDLYEDWDSMTDEEQIAAIEAFHEGRADLKEPGYVWWKA